MRPRRLLFVIGKGQLDASGQKRVYELLPLFAARGYETRVISYQWELLWAMRLRADLGEKVPRSLLWLLNATRLSGRAIAQRNTRARAQWTRLTQWADVTIVNQTFLDPEWRQSLRSARRVVYEIDDAVWLADERQFRDMLALAHTVVAGNDYLASIAAQHHGDVHVVPTSVRTDRYRDRPDRAANEGRCRIGWIGSPASAVYLSLLQEPLDQLGPERALTFCVVGSGQAPLPSFTHVSVDARPLVPYDPTAVVPGFDIGVMPLFDTPLERGKCGAKLLDYMAAGIPVVCSPVGANLQIVEDGVTGYFAGTAGEWAECLRRLVDDPALRTRMGRAGQQAVRARYSADLAVARWDRLLGAAAQQASA